MDLQAAADGENLGDDESATALLRRDHQALRKAFVHYRELMDGAAAERAGVAQGISMQLELHFAVTREIFYPAMAQREARLVHELKHAQEDIEECVTALRGAPAGDSAELDSTMVRLMELADVYFCKERELVQAAEIDPKGVEPLGARMVARRKEIAGSVGDLESRS